MATKADDPFSGPSDGNLTARRVGIAAGAAVALWLAMAVTLAQVAPTRSLSITPSFLNIDGAAGMREAAAGLATHRPPAVQVAAAKAVAVRTLLHESTNVAAARSLALGLALEGKTRASLLAFDYAERLSRRDTPTEVSLIEFYVQRGDIAPALLRYDRAMRSSAPIRETLIPILANAANSLEIARKLSPLLSRKPNWLSDYLTYAVRSASVPQSLYLQVSGARLLPTGTDRYLLSETIEHLVQLGRPDLGWRLYRRTVPIAGEPGGIQNGGFERVSGFPPFDWALADTTDLSPSIQPIDGASNVALVLSANQAGELARQMLWLTSGSYELTATVGAVSAEPSARPILTVQCGNGKILVQQPFPAGESAHRAQWIFTQPGDDCRVQTLILGTGAAPEGQQQPWIDDLRVVRKGAR